VLLVPESSPASEPCALGEERGRMTTRRFGRVSHETLEIEELL
jgi:hypothetical protein